MIEQVRLGRTGLHVSRLALGMMSYGDRSSRPWILDQQAAEPIVRRALEAGITFFDTADMYSNGASEIVTGRLLAKVASREEVVIATKAFYPTTRGPNGRGLSRKHLLAAIDASLERLRTDYVDLYQVHRWDPQTPIEETMEALDDIVRAGKARYIGASTMAAWQFGKAQATAIQHGWTRFVSMQNLYNLLYREEEREMIPSCVDQGVAVLPYSPLGRGLLTRHPGESTTLRARSDPIQQQISRQAGDEDVVEALIAVAAARGVPPARVALAWLLRRPGITAPILGATKITHLDDALRALSLDLTDDEIDELERPYRPHEPI